MDGIISAPALCHFEVQSLVGQKYDCNGTSVRWTPKLAKVVDTIWNGPTTPQGQFLWWGYTRGANFSGVVPNINASVAAPFDISDTWIRGFVVKDKSFDTAGVSYAQFSGTLRGLSEQVSLRAYSYVWYWSGSFVKRRICLSEACLSERSCQKHLSEAICQVPFLGVVEADCISCGRPLPPIAPAIRFHHRRFFAGFETLQVQRRQNNNMAR